MDKSEGMAVNSTLLSPRTFVTMLRVLWAALAVVMGFTIGSTDDQVSEAAGFVSASGWWLTVAVVVVSLVVPSAVGLTVVRMISPLTPVIAVAALVFGAAVGWAAAAIALSVVVALLALSGEVGEVMVQGSAYGAERRFPLRSPAPLLLPVVLTWLLWAASVVASALLIAATQWLWFTLTCTVALLLTWLVGTRSHRLSRRWLVLVPVGLVVHDHVVLGETLMVQKGNVAQVSLALDGTEAADLSGPASGVLVEVAVREMVLATFPATRTEPKGRAIHVKSFLVAPSRPGRAMAAMTEAGFPVG